MVDIRQGPDPTQSREGAKLKFILVLVAVSVLACDRKG
jgi:hypothetical protein